MKGFSREVLKNRNGAEYMHCMIIMTEHRFELGKERHEGVEEFIRMKMWKGQWMRGDGVAD